MDRAFAVMARLAEAQAALLNLPVIVTHAVRDTREEADALLQSLESAPPPGYVEMWVAPFDKDRFNPPSGWPRD